MISALVTGATGFVGSSVVRVLLQAGCRVRVLVRHGADEKVIYGLDLQKVEGDLRDPESLRQAVQGCDQVYHVAASYKYWTRNPSEIYATNVDGTRNLLQAALKAGVQRVVYTSSVATLGLPKDGTPGTEETPSSLADMISDYKRSKFMAEEVAREFVAHGLPVIIVNPSTPVGPRDVKPTPTGQIILDFLKGRMPAFVDTGLNIVDVEDVALGHWLAAQKGQPGRRYILGNCNLTLAEIFQLLSAISGRPAPNVRIPHSLAMLFALADTGLAYLFPRHVPRATPDTVRLSKKHMFFDSSRAVRELGFPQNDVRQALQKAVDWFQTNNL
jgi:dihydroflavonol-4-reductase